MLKLDNSHAYYYQIQTQLFVCDLNYCDFCICTFVEDHEEDSLHVERIYKNQRFWEECLPKAEYFFKTFLLLEILGNWYTRDSIGTTETQNGEPSASVVEKETYCYCHGSEEGLMIACDNPDCSIEWFYARCLHLFSAP